MTDTPRSNPPSPFRSRQGGTGYSGDTATEVYPPDQSGFFIRATIYTDVEPDWPITREEIFGPELITMPFDTESEAIALANDTEYGLLGSVWSGDLARAVRVAEQIEAGQVTVNGRALGIETPLGGYKIGGYGREKGLEALHDYVQIKAISIGIGPP